MHDSDLWLAFMQVMRKRLNQIGTLSMGVERGLN